MLGFQLTVPGGPDTWLDFLSRALAGLVSSSVLKRLNAIDANVPLADFETLDRVAQSLKEPR